MGLREAQLPAILGVEEAMLTSGNGRGDLPQGDLSVWTVEKVCCDNELWVISERPWRLWEVEEEDLRAAMAVGEICRRQQARLEFISKNEDTYKAHLRQFGSGDVVHVSNLRKVNESEWYIYDMCRNSTARVNIYQASVQVTEGLQIPVVDYSRNDVSRVMGRVEAHACRRDGRRLARLRGMETGI